MVHSFIKIRLLGLALLLSLGWSAPNNIHQKIDDPWLGFVKVQHFTFSCLMTLSSQYILVNKYNMAENEAALYSASSSLFIGIEKEILDKKKPKRFFSRRDLVADILGIGFALILINLPSS